MEQLQTLRMEGLTVSYHQGPPVVDDVSINVKRGEIVGVIGESGSGKSTVAMASIGLLPESAVVDADSLEVAGNEILHITEKKLRSLRGRVMSMVFQEPMTALNPVMKVGEQIGEVLLIHGLADKKKARARSLEILELVHMPDPEIRIDQYPHQLSGGQRQRVMIAIALAAEPEILIADEPTTALDVTVQAQILSLLVELRNRLGLGILIISHDLGVVGAMCDRIAVMFRGKIVEMGTPQQVLEQPQDPYTKALIECVPGPHLPPRSRLRVVDNGDERVSRIDPSLTSNDQSLNGESLSDKPFLRFENVTKTYKVGRNRIQALKGITFDIRKGETFGVVGESGSGKSTLAQIAMKIEPPTSGQVLLDGEDIYSFKGKEQQMLRRRLQMVFQDPNDTLDPRSSIGASIAEPLLATGISRASARKRVEECLDLVAIPRTLMDRRPHEFSGGQRQRIAIARALAPEPELILLDEPTSALDVSVQAQILNLLVDIQDATGVTLMFISHDLAVVRHLSHRIAVMCKGDLVESGPAEQIFTNPREDYTKRLLNAVRNPLGDSFAT